MGDIVRLPLEKARPLQEDTTTECYTRFEEHLASAYASQIGVKLPVTAGGGSCWAEQREQSKALDQEIQVRLDEAGRADWDQVTKEIQTEIARLKSLGDVE
jgi:hypothetical protein